MLRVTHNAGFFSCCTIKLENILEYHRRYKKLPEVVDSSQQFNDYKIDKTKDITFDYFKKYDEIDIDISYVKDVYVTPINKEQQFSEYNKLNFTDLKPFITKYFSPSDKIETQIKVLIEKYNIDTDKTCGIRYRGNDKILETIQPTYDDMVQKAVYIKKNNKDMRFLVQTDEKEFLDYFMSSISNSFHIEEAPKINKKLMSIQHINYNNKEFATMCYIASLHIISKCKYIITTSGNGEMWITLYRGNSNNIFQYLRPKQNSYGVNNNSYQAQPDYFWIDN